MMTPDPHEQLKAFRPACRFFVGVQNRDSHLFRARPNVVYRHGLP